MGQRLLLSICAVHTLVYLVSLLASSLSPQRFWPAGLVTIAFPFLLVGQLLCSGVFWRKAGRNGRFLSLLLVPGLVHVPAYVNGSHWTDGSFRVLCLNTNYFGALQNRSQVVANIEATQSVLRDLRPDLVCAQDYSSDSEPHNELIHQFMLDTLGLHERIYCTPSMSTYSAQKIGHYEGAFFPDSQNSYCWIDTVLGGRPVRVFNLHLQSYQLPGLRRGLLGRLRQGLRKRGEQAEIVSDRIAASPHPVIVCGDFNDVPTSYAYAEVSAGLRDGFRDAGRGLAVTYRRIPGLRIDYILCSPELRFTRYEHLDGPGCMDHRWVYAELRWADQGR